MSAAGPRFWIEARKAVGSCAPLNGTVNCGSVATVKFMPGCVGVIVTSTVVWASRLESVCDWAMIWIGYVPLCRPGAGVAVTLPLLSIVTVQPGGALAVRL